MNDDVIFERNAQAWLEVGPAVAPDRVVQAALHTIETTPQQRDLRTPWRFPTLRLSSRFAMAAVVAIAVIAAGFVLFQGRPSQVGNPVASPTPEASPVSSLPWIVFNSHGRPDLSTVKTDAQLQLWAVRADGSGLHVLAGGMAVESSGFDISPDGSRIAFTSADQLIWEAPIEGGDATLLSTNCGGQASDNPGTCAELDPTYSPDGSAIAFLRFETNVGDVIAVRDRRNGDMRSIEVTRTTGNFYSWFMHPTWSPDSTQIAFAHMEDGYRNKGKSNLAVVEADGSALLDLPLPAGATLAAAPYWSPDGSAILFSTSPSSWDYTPQGAGPWLYTIHPDGTGLVSVCAECAMDGQEASWTPDGTHIVFWSGHSWALMEPDGANQAFINELELTYPGAQLPYGSSARIQP